MVAQFVKIPYFNIFSPSYLEIGSEPHILLPFSSPFFEPSRKRRRQWLQDVFPTHEKYFRGNLLNEKRVNRRKMRQVPDRTAI